MQELESEDLDLDLDIDSLELDEKGDDSAIWEQKSSSAPEAGLMESDFSAPGKEDYAREAENYSAKEEETEEGILGEESDIEDSIFEDSFNDIEMPQEETREDDDIEIGDIPDIVSDTEDDSPAVSSEEPPLDVADFSELGLDTEDDSPAVSSEEPPLDVADFSELGLDTEDDSPAVSSEEPPLDVADFSELGLDTEDDSPAVSSEEPPLNVADFSEGLDMGDESAAPSSEEPSLDTTDFLDLDLDLDMGDDSPAPSPKEETAFSQEELANVLDDKEEDFDPDLIPLDTPSPASGLDGEGLDDDSALAETASILVESEENETPVSLTENELSNIASQAGKEEVAESFPSPPSLGGIDDEVDAMSDSIGVFPEIEELGQMGLETPPASKSFVSPDIKKGDTEIALSTHELDGIIDEAEQAPGGGKDEGGMGSLYDVAPEEEELLLAEEDMPVLEAPPDMSPLTTGGALTPDREEAAMAISEESGLNKEELRKMIGYLDLLFDKLPETTIREFSRSEYFDLYKKIMGELGI